ncbi:MAG: glycosyltransferase family 2 protein [Lachnospiraceae bacterium]
MKENPLISIIVAIYNGERYISECIESIMNQDYKNLQIILVDDGSTDNSGTIADKYKQKDSRIIVIHQENGGVSVARNTGLEYVKGEYVCIVDQDDFLSEDYVTYFYKLIVDNDAQISMTPTALKVLSTEKITEDITNDEDYVEIWEGNHAVVQMLYYNVIIAPWNKMISRKLIEDNCIRFVPKLFGGEGFAFSIENFQYAKRVAVGHRKVYRYRVDNPDSGMTRFNKQVLDNSIRAQEIISSKILHHTNEIEKALKYANWHTHCDCLNTIIGCQVLNENKQYYQSIKKVCRRDARIALNAPISRKDKIKGFVYFINPYLAAKIINRFRLRKFTKEIEG